MYCLQCGTENENTARVCRVCGSTLPVSTSSQAFAIGSEFDLDDRNVTNHLVPAILVTLFCCMPTGMVSIFYAGRVNSKLAMGDVQGARADSNRAKTWAIVSAALGIVPVFLIFGAISIPTLMRTRGTTTSTAMTTADETAAIASIRTINTAETAYSRSYAGVGYACRLGDLGGAPADCGSIANHTAQHACLIENGLASGRKAGYRFAVLNCEAQHYRVIAEPVTRARSGQRAFCSDQTGVIRSVRDGSGQQCLESGTPLK